MGSFVENREQVDVVETVLRSFLIDCGVERSACGILTWYNGPKLSIQKSVACHGVCLANVDGVQGEERDVMIVSAVCSNAHDRLLGFTKSANRLHVTLTRAKGGSVVILQNVDFNKRRGKHRLKANSRKRPKGYHK